MTNKQFINIIANCDNNLLYDDDAISTHETEIEITNGTELIEGDDSNVERAKSNQIDENSAQSSNSQSIEHSLTHSNSIRISKKITSIDNETTNINVSKRARTKQPYVELISNISKVKIVLDRNVVTEYMKKNDLSVDRSKSKRTTKNTTSSGSETTSVSVSKHAKSKQTGANSTLQLIEASNAESTAVAFGPKRTTINTKSSGIEDPDYPVSKRTSSRPVEENSSQSSVESICSVPRRSKRTAKHTIDNDDATTSVPVTKRIKLHERNTTLSLSTNGKKSKFIKYRPHEGTDDTLDLVDSNSEEIMAQFTRNDSAISEMEEKFDEVARKFEWNMDPSNIECIMGCHRRKSTILLPCRHQHTCEQCWFLYKIYQIV